MGRPQKIPSYRLHKPSGRAVVTIRGHDHYLGKHGSPESFENYKELIAGWKPKAAPELGHRPLSVSVLVAQYLMRRAIPRYTRTDPETGKSVPMPSLHRAKTALTTLVALKGTMPAAEFGPRALNELRDRFVAHGYSRKQVNALVGCVRRAFRWAVAEEILPATHLHAFWALENLRPGEGKDYPAVKKVPDEDIAPVQAAVLPPIRDLIEFQLLTACRPGEACALRPCDLDRSGQVWTYCPPLHKTVKLGHVRTIYIGPKAQRMLLPYLERRQPDEYVFSPREAMIAALTAMRRKPRTGAGKRYSVSAYTRAIRVACDRLGLPRWRPHRLRHSAATRLVAEFGYETARIILGHRHVSTTLLYAEDNKLKAVEAIQHVG